ncbi:aspartyl/asparaginyl beta-hydroxylase (cupin superfamily) [Bradyrhizobium sp. AZCC 2230]
MDRASVLVWSSRMFGSLYQVRLTGKRFKAWNKYVYHTAKYTVASTLRAVCSGSYSALI